VPGVLISSGSVLNAGSQRAMGFKRWFFANWTGPSYDELEDESNYDDF
jgi:hypothetical protein